MKKKFIKTPLVGVQVHGANDVGTRTVNLLMGEHAGEYVRGDIMDANAVIQAFDELKGNVDNKADATALTALEQKVTANTTAIDTKQPKGNYLTEHQSLEEYAKKTELPTVPTKVSQLTNDSEFITKSVYDEKIAALEARIAALEAKHPETAA